MGYICLGLYKFVVDDILPFLNAVLMRNWIQETFETYGVEKLLLRFQRRVLYVILTTQGAFLLLIQYEPHRDKTNKMACAPSEDSDQPGHPPSLIRVFAVRLKTARVLAKDQMLLHANSEGSDQTGRMPRLI